MSDHTTHTPGPSWFALSGGAISESVMADWNNPENLIARANLKHPDADANLKLAAAAPELLEALQRLLAHTTERNDDYDALSNAESAIARATGNA